MFGFQRTGDSFWAAADQMTRGFIIGATAGRTTLTGEGLQHADGHSPILAATNPAVVTYDPAYGYEMGAHHARRPRTGCTARRSREEIADNDPSRNLMYYITVYNEPIVQPAEPENLDVEGIIKGIYRGAGAGSDGPRTQILASGVSVPWALEAQRILAEDWGVSADVWSVTSWTELRRDGHGRRGRSLPQPRPARPRPVRDPAARRRHRSDRGGHRLHEGRAGPDPPVPAERVRLARRGRLRLLRHPRRGPPLLQERHPLDCGEDPAAAGLAAARSTAGCPPTR